MSAQLAPRRGAVSWLISSDRPGSPLLTGVLLLVLFCLAVEPFLIEPLRNLAGLMHMESLVPGDTRALATAGRICVFIVLAASYDMLLGYTGIVSFAHAMFFGIGAYGVAIAISKGLAGWLGVLVGGAAGIAVSVVLAVIIGLLSLRVRAIFFSMITLAIASFALILAGRLRGLTNGEDGISFAVPDILAPSFRLFDERVLGARIGGAFITYYLIFIVALILFLLMLRIVNSPFGRVLQAIRENDFRAEALGYRTVIYRTLASALSAGIAASAGILIALQQRYNGTGTLSFDYMVDILLMVVIGGMGTLYGPVLGAVIIVLAQFYLQPAMGAVAHSLAGVPLLPALFDPDRWLFWLGLLFVLIVYFFPAGIVGTLRQRRVR